MFTIRDTDLLMLSYLDDSTILNFSKTCKKAYKLCENEIFWKNRFIEQYNNEAIPFRKRSWKDWYFVMKQYMTFDIYIYGLAINGMEFASKNNYRDLIDYIIFSEEEACYTMGLKGAVEGCHIELVKFFLDKGVRELNLNLYYSARKGGEKYKEIIELLISKGADGFDTAMKAAILGGNLDILKFLISKTKNINWNRLLSVAEMENKEKIVRYLWNEI